MNSASVSGCRSRESASLMIDHDVGVRILRTIALKRLDLDYFEDPQA